MWIVPSSEPDASVQSCGENNTCMTCCPSLRLQKCTVFSVCAEAMYFPFGENAWSWSEIVFASSTTSSF